MGKFKVLSGKEADIAMSWLKAAAGKATSSTCHRSKCGSVIVSPHGTLLGTGFNSPPLNVCLNTCIKDSLPKGFKSDKTCCIHAEERAIMDALRHHADQIAGSRLYFIRLDDNNQMIHAGQPFCSKMALDTGISEFVLWHESGITVYDTHYYNELSFQYSQKPADLPEADSNGDIGLILA